MSAMSFREPNEVKWVGVRPAHKGTQKLIRKVGVTADIEVYSVPADTTFYMTSMFVNLKAPNGDERVTIRIRDTADNTIHIPLQINTAVAGQEVVSRNFYPPVEVPSGYDIYIDVAGTAPTVNLALEGWEE